MPNARVPVRRRARKGEGDLLRAEILDAAEALLIETGSEEAVSIRAVAERVGVTPPSIYRHFPDKASLIFDVCWRECDRLAEAIKTASTEVGDDPLEFYRRGTRAYVQFAVDHPEHYRILMMTKTEMRPDRAWLEGIDNAFRLLLEGIAKLRDTGRLRDTFAAYDDFGLAQLMWSAMHGLASLLITFPDLAWLDLDELIDRHTELVFHGVLVEDSSTTEHTKRRPKARVRS